MKLPVPAAQASFSLKSSSRNPSFAAETSRRAESWPPIETTDRASGISLCRPRVCAVVSISKYVSMALAMASPWVPVNTTRETLSGPYSFSTWASVRAHSSSVRPKWRW
ncbi:MAG: hypothetical protein BWY66_01109 [bacterium ADurb.Bin374]|nr:MAG: hypothetical protein BWY66_01109 [bacterium ADurb.Bin374]